MSRRRSRRCCSPSASRRSTFARRSASRTSPPEHMCPPIPGSSAAYALHSSSSAHGVSCISRQGTCGRKSLPQKKVSSTMSFSTRSNANPPALRCCSASRSSRKLRSSLSSPSSLSAPSAFTPTSVSVSSPLSSSSSSSSPAPFLLPRSISNSKRRQSRRRAMSSTSKGSCCTCVHSFSAIESCSTESAPPKPSRTMSRRGSCVTSASRIKSASWPTSTRTTFGS
mmetsp:Transcript_10561/g.34708  ORF Transcript_10561/g.34708 Transcript_10561/m.34708 type:complete len:225 (+) Transcript_10561:615-1289(+)